MMNRLVHASRATARQVRTTENSLINRSLRQQIPDRRFPDQR